MKKPNWETALEIILTIIFGIIKIAITLGILFGLSLAILNIIDACSNDQWLIDFPAKPLIIAVLNSRGINL